jgi:hypothetical protein
MAKPKEKVSQFSERLPWGQVSQRYQHSGGPIAHVQPCQPTLSEQHTVKLTGTALDYWMQAAIMSYEKR